VIIAGGCSESERIQTALQSGAPACMKKPYSLKGNGARVLAALSPDSGH
jgi:hypothetical protein